MNKILNIFCGNSAKNSANKIKASLMAVFLGLAVGTIPIFIGGGDPVVGYYTLFTSGFVSITFNDFIAYGSVFTLLGLGIGISFKTGLFNIGAAGQFMFAGAITTIMGILIHTWDKSMALPILILIAAAAGAITAGIAGALKAFFNVHEVVSTILMNWSLFYLIKWIFLKPKFKSATSNASKVVNDSMKFSLGANSNDVWYILGIALIIVLLIFFLFKFTTFGFSLRVNGINKYAAIYGGINTKKNTILSMMLSGGVVGIAGFIFYSSVQGQMPSLGGALNSWGFEAITVTLLAFSSPLGMPVAGFFYAMMKISTKDAGLSAGVSGETFDLVLGIIILFSALAPLLQHFKPFRLLYTKTKFYLDKETNKFKKTKKIDSRLSNQVYKGEVKFYNKEKKHNNQKSKEIQSSWLNEIQEITNQFNTQKISTEEKELMVKESNDKHSEMLSDLNIKSLKQIKDEYKNRNELIRQEIKSFELIRMDEIFSKGGK